MLTPDQARALNKAKMRMYGLGKATSGATSRITGAASNEMIRGFAGKLFRDGLTEEEVRQQLNRSFNLELTPTEYRLFLQTLGGSEELARTTTSVSVRVPPPVNVEFEEDSPEAQLKELMAQSIERSGFVHKVFKHQADPIAQIMAAGKHIPREKLHDLLATSRCAGEAAQVAAKILDMSKTATLTVFTNGMAPPVALKQLSNGKQVIEIQPAPPKELEAPLDDDSETELWEPELV